MTFSVALHAESIGCIITNHACMQEAAKEAEAADWRLQTSAHQDQLEQLLSAAKAKDIQVADASKKLDDFTQQLASHEQQSEQTAAAREADMAELTKQLQDAEAGRVESAKQLQMAEAAREAVVSELTTQLQRAESAARAVSVSTSTEVNDLKQRLACAQAEASHSMVSKAAELADLTQQLQSSQHSLSELAEQAAAVKGQVAERSLELTQQQKLVKQLQASESASQARLLAMTESSSEQVRHQLLNLLCGAICISLTSHASE